MTMWQSRSAPGAARSPGRATRRRIFTAGAVTATVAAMASLAIGGSAQAALAPGTPLKTLAAANGSRYFGSDMTGDLLNNTTVTQLQAQQFNMLTPGNEMKWDTTQPSPPPAAFNFTPGRRDRQLRQGQQRAGALSQPGLAQPAPGVGEQPAV